MKTCSTCKHYRPDSVDQYPGCEKIESYSNNDTTFLVATVSMLGGSFLQINDPDAFGCLLHEERPIEPKIPDEVWGVFRVSDGALERRKSVPVLWTSELEAQQFVDYWCGGNDPPVYRVARVK